jgi:uncharacterized protein YndB with AHSA1/START domain
MLGFLRDLYAPSTVEKVLSAPPDTVFDILAEPRTYPDWLVGAEHMRAVDPEFPRQGAEFQHSVGPTKGLTVDDKTKSLGAVEDHRLALEVHAGPFVARVDFELLPEPGGRTRVRFSERPLGVFAPLTPLLRPTLHARNSASLDRLERLVAASA